ncbi:MAG: hypothetical protein GXP31_11735 [Kiritimatiellaeota bacterium]|nr:hypothetical protein [Kiritimatiellota bacterium]
MMVKPSYRCLYNHEMLILFTSQTPWQPYCEPVGDEQVRRYVRELEGTQVDALMCCPTAWRAVLWPSEVDPRWETEDVERVEPPRQCDLKYYEKAYWRVREYMLQGKDPVRLTRDTARAQGLAFFFSYRMNDHHYLWNETCPTHDRFWRGHPEFRLGSGAGAHFNYQHREVRDYYLALLTELCTRYAPDGLELDFMRSPVYFPRGSESEGRDVMTGFVRRVRKMLDETAGERGRLPLCVRVPHTLERALKAGLDVEAWAHEGLVDMVNISPFFRSTPEVAVEQFREHLPADTAVYAELHFITQQGRNPVHGFTNNYLQKTTVEQYETLAFEFWERGADGLSFFNFAYCRDHSFGEPRRLEFPGVEPPFDMLRTICDRDALAGRPKHYVIGAGFDLLPRPIRPDVPAELEFLVHANVSDGGPHETAALRIETAEPCWRVPFEVELNGCALEHSNYVGELFVPFTREGLPAARNVEHFIVPLGLLRHGKNHARVSTKNRAPARL